MSKGNISSILTAAGSNDGFKRLIKEFEQFLSSKEDAPPIDHDSKDKALAIVYDGYTTLPKVYQDVFLDPFKTFLQNYDYAQIMETFGQGPLIDWLACIKQRSNKYLSNATHAFEEIVADLYDGYLSNTERRRIKPPGSSDRVTIGDME